MLSSAYPQENCNYVKLASPPHQLVLIEVRSTLRHVLPLLDLLRCRYFQQRWYHSKVRSIFPATRLCQKSIPEALTWNAPWSWHCSIRHKFSCALYCIYRISIDNYTMDWNIKSVQSAKTNVFTYWHILTTWVSTIVSKITLCAHFTHPYWALDTLLNHYY